MKTKLSAEDLTIMDGSALRKFFAALISRKTKVPVREFFGFSLAGGLSLMTDLATFNLLTLGGVNFSTANIVATCIALVVNFLANHWAFLPRGLIRTKIASKSLRFSALAAASALLLIVGFEIVLLEFPNQSVGFYTLARTFLIAIGTTARFITLKYWVFK